MGSFDARAVTHRNYYSAPFCIWTFRCDISILEERCSDLPKPFRVKKEIVDFFYITLTERL